MLNLPVLLLYFLLTAIVGRALCYRFLQQQGVNPPLVTQVLTGHLVITALYAVAMTQGKTYLVIPLVLCFALFLVGLFSKGKRELPVSSGLANLQLTPNIKNSRLLIIVIASVLIGFLSMYLRIYDPIIGLKKIHTDFTFYGGISDYMNRFGIESLILDPITPSDKYQPYHYFELWNAAMFAKIFNNPGLRSLMLLTYPFHIALVLLGFYEYIKLEKLSIKFPLAILVILFAAPLGYLLSMVVDYTPFSKLGFISEHGIQTKMGMKLFGVHAISVLFLYIFSAKDKLNFALVIFLGTLLFIYPTTVPLGSLFLLLYWGYQYFGSKIHGRVSLFGPALPLAALCVGIVAIFFRSATIYAAFEVFRSLLSFAFIGLIFALKPPKNKFQAVFISLFISIFFLVFALRILMPSYSALQDPNILQVISNFVDPFLLVGMIAVIIHFLAHSKKILRYSLLALVMAVYFIQGHFGQTFQRSAMSANIDTGLIQSLNSPEAVNTAFIRDQEDYLRTTTAWNPYYDVPLHNMRWFTKNYFPICLSLPSKEMYINNDSKKRWFESITMESAYYQFLQNQKADSQMTEEELKALFIKRYNIIKVIDDPKR